MDESFYPILWQEAGPPSAFIGSHLQGGTREYRSHAWRKEQLED